LLKNAHIGAKGLGRKRPLKEDEIDAILTNGILNTQKQI